MVLKDYCYRFGITFISKISLSHLTLVSNLTKAISNKCCNKSVLNCIFLNLNAPVIK